MPEVSMADIAMSNFMFHFYFYMGGDDMEKKIQLSSFPFCRFFLLETTETVEVCIWGSLSFKCNLETASGFI
jgi:hypothetical protein